ncbi:RuBisCO large subunit C-terminal-like domain-containing protein [Clostridium oryzae]|uniref:2,3-diketo-5-methylthiopentyl-1-phosphate enolase n=1 Tax=Clostridium oryzae TaxID=1450648 RepID=A0A1V4IY17_9CLOT|nr:RuBisCO large subunit C-terminal-like domain-containing protein [Clostridium oryzae]OPJ64675.1 2,3-diketo-5-methylthiopentyl-1-phosphate enolase [Clostridium oryzae]
MFFSGQTKLKLPVQRFSVDYKIIGNNKEEAYAKAKDICVEQTAEFPEELVPQGVISDNILGRIENFRNINDNTFVARISYAVDSAAGELTQLLNVIFGNISIKPGIRVENINITPELAEKFKGPRFGTNGLRGILDVKDRPLLFTALKPMGVPAKELAEIAYKFAIGGIDIIKDDHGLSNQPFCDFEERVKLCAAAVEKANRETGNKSIYMPNITGPHSEIVSRAKKAKELGAGGLLISPGLTGFDVIREIADNDDINLPIMGHPAFLGSYVFGENGISHKALFGQIMRLAGADGTIYPNFGGRFSFTVQECESIVEGATEYMEGLKPIFPCPAGGMTLESIPQSLKVYGKNVVFLVGGGLFKHGDDLIESSRYFRKIIE